MMAKSLVRNRHAVTKMYGLKSQLQAVSLRMAVGGFVGGTFHLCMNECHSTVCALVPFSSAAQLLALLALV